MPQPLSAAAAFLSVASVAGVVFASVQLTRANATIEKVEARLAALERTNGVVPGEKGASGDAGSDSPGSGAKVETLGDAIREVKRLHEEVDALRAHDGEKPVSSPTPKTDPGSKPADASPKFSPEETAMRKVVDTVLAEKEQERVDAEKKRQAEWQKARLERQINDMTERLGLSAQQKDQVAQVMTTFSAQQADLWANRKEGEDMGPKMRELREQTTAGVKQYLTSEQQVKYDEYLKTEGRPRWGGGDGGSIQPAQPR